MGNNYFIGSDGELYHWQLKNHKYISREKKGNKWVYTYPSDNKGSSAGTPALPEHKKQQMQAKTQTRANTINSRGSSGVGTGPRLVSKEYEAEMGYNSKKNEYPKPKMVSTSTNKSNSNANTKVSTGKNALTPTAKVSKEYEAEVAYNSQKNTYPSGSATKTTSKKADEKKESVLDKSGKWVSSAIKNIVNGIDKLTGAAAKDNIAKAKSDERNFELKNFSYLRNTAVKLGEEYRKLEDKISDKSKQVAEDRSDYVKKQTIAAEKEEIRKQIHDTLYPTSSTNTGLLIPNQELSQPRKNKLDSELGKAETEASDAWREAEKARRKLDTSTAGLKELEKKRGELEKSIESVYDSYYNSLDTRDKLREKTLDAVKEYSETMLGKLEALPDTIRGFISDIAFETEYAYDRAKDWTSDAVSTIADNTIGEMADWYGIDDKRHYNYTEQELERSARKYQSAFDVYQRTRDLIKTYPDSDIFKQSLEDRARDLTRYEDESKKAIKEWELAKDAYEDTPCAKVDDWLESLEDWWEELKRK